MRHFSLLLVGAGLGLCLFTGMGVACKRRSPKPQPAPVSPTESAEPQTQAAPGVSPPTSVSTPLPIPVPPPTDRATQENLRFLTEQLREFVVQQKRFPKSFAEFQSMKIDSPRRPPPGMQWALDEQSKSIVLVAKP